MSGLDQVMNRLKKSPVSQPQVKKKVETPILEDESEEEIEETEEDIDDEETEEDESEEEIEEKPVTTKKIAPKPTQMNKVEEKLTQPNMDEVQKQRAEEVQLLQNNGIYRVETLFQLGLLNKNLESIIKILKGE